MIRAVFLGLAGLVAASAGDGPVREFSAPVVFQGQPLPGFYNGYVFRSVPMHMLELFGPDGHNTSLTIQGRGNGHPQVLGIAIDADGTLAIPWSDYPNGGIELRDSFNKVVRTIDTGRFVPAHVSFAPDHSLWALGWQRDATVPTTWDKRGDYPILRKYSMDGTQTGAYVSSLLFPNGLPPGRSSWQLRRITVTKDRVGIVVTSGTSGSKREWIELDLNGSILSRWRIDDADTPPDVAFTSDNQAYVQRRDEKRKIKGVYRLNRENATWDLIESPHSVTLYGADENYLVFARWPDIMIRLSWFRPGKVVPNQTLPAIAVKTAEPR